MFASPNFRHGGYPPDIAQQKLRQHIFYRELTRDNFLYLDLFDHSMSIARCNADKTEWRLFRLPNAMAALMWPLCMSLATDEDKSDPLKLLYPAAKYLVHETLPC